MAGKTPEKRSQVVQVDEDGARRLLAVIEEAFPTCGEPGGVAGHACLRRERLLKVTVGSASDAGGWGCR